MMRSLTSNHGKSWITRGFSIFKEHPGVWIGITILFNLLNLIPILGNFALVGVFHACRESEAGRRPRVHHVFSGFTIRPGQVFILSLIIFLIQSGFFLLLKSVTGEDTQSIGTALMSAAMGFILPSFFKSVWTILAVLVFEVVMFMISWFSTALVAFSEIAPLRAMQISFVACQKNAGAFTIYGLISAFLLLICGVTAGLALFVVLPVLTISYFTSYREIFGE